MKEIESLYEKSEVLKREICDALERFHGSTGLGLNYFIFEETTTMHIFVKDYEEGTRPIPKVAIHINLF